MIPSISQSGVTGIQRGLQQANQAASNIASASNAQGQLGVEGIASNIVDLKLGTYQVQASAKVVQTENQMLGSLLDTRV